MKKIVLNLLAAVLLLTTACEDDEKKVAVTSVKFKEKEISLTLTSKIILEYTVEPENAENKDVTWRSADNNVATVSEDGEVHAVGLGMTTITVTTVDRKIKANCIVTVSQAKVSVTGVTLNKPTLTLDEGKKDETIKATVEPKDADNQGVRWTSKDVNVAYVDAKGVITAVAKGTTMITVTTNEGGFKDSCKVTVNEKIVPVTNVKLSHSELWLKEDKRQTIKATVEPANATNKKLKWSMEDGVGIVTLSDTEGDEIEITAIAVGKATIIVTAEDNQTIQTCRVTVTDDSEEDIDDPDPDDWEEVRISMGATLNTVIQQNPGKIIILPTGYTAAITGSSGIGLPWGGIHLKGEPGGNRPVITVSGTAFNLNGLTSGYDIIRFENIEFVHTATASGYFFNQANSDAATCKIKELSFENCHLKDFPRSIVRTQRSEPEQSFDLVKFNKCIIENCSREVDQGYAMIQSNLPMAFSDIKITNTTIINQGSDLVAVRGGSGQAACKTVLIENCTFYKSIGSNNATADNRFVVDAGNNGPVDITIKNCIFGSVKGRGMERGYRMYVTSTMTAEGNYSTTEWTTVADESASPPMRNIPATPYEGDCNKLFVNPVNGNFRIEDNAFEGKGVAGDPRWW